jgi:5-methylcytosine-specific restriction enzyme B
MPFVQKIFYGPPGTGKTWSAAREAVRAVEPEAFAKALTLPDPGLAIEQLHSGLVKSGRILWVTFHPSYSYEDFIEGYRPIVDEKGRLSYKVIDGPFKQLCARARAEVDLQIGEVLKVVKGRKPASVVDKDGGGWLIQITPNRKDEVAEQLYRYVPRVFLQRFFDAHLPPTVFSIPGKGLVPIEDSGHPTPPRGKRLRCGSVAP